MADIQSNIQINIDTQDALANLRRLQAEISTFQTQLAKGSAAGAAKAANFQQNLMDSINMSGKFAARMTNIQSTTEAFTTALEKNKLSLGQYFRFAAASTNTFGKNFAKEFATIDKVARERVKSLQTQYISVGRDASGALKAIAVRPLALDLDNLSTKTAIAAQKQQLLNQLLKQGSTNLLNFGKNTQWAGRQLMVGFTIPLTILGTTASRVFMEMEEQVIKFRKVYGDLFTPEAEKQQALKDIQDLGSEFTKYGISVANTIGLAAEAAAAGFGGAALQAQVTQATRLSVLGQIDQQKALETTIALQNAFRISTEDLGNSINFLNAVENQTVISLDDITSAIPRVAPVIQQLGGDVKDLSFFLAAMKESGISAEQGANALKSGLASLINPTKQSRDMLLGMGVDIQNIVNTNAGDLAGTVAAVANALDQLDPLQRARAIEQLFGKFQFARISALFDNITRDGTQAKRVLDLAGASVEELAMLTEGELGVVAGSTSAKFQKAVEDIRAALAPVGEDFLKIATPIIEFGTKVLDAFNNMESGTKRVILGIIAVLGGLGPVALMTFGLLANGVANVIKFVTFLRERFLGLGQQSTVLGEQTSYLTNEQIKAEAVAASLAQAHTNLTQKFTSEASAIAMLTAEYERLVGIQAASRAAGAGGVPSQGKPRKFASGGIVKGPGTGTSDSIAAMISNGEAIIPADMVKKYGPLIQGIIADQIPGFANGTTSLDLQGMWQASHFGGSQSMTGAQLIARVDELEAAGLAVKGATEEIRRMVATSTTGLKDLFRVFDNRVVALSKEVNQGLGESGSGQTVAAGLVRKDLSRGGGAAHIELIRQLEAAGKSPEEVKAATTELAKIIDQKFEQIGDATEVTAEVVDDVIDKAYRQVSKTNKDVKAAYAEMQQITTVTDRTGARGAQGERRAISRRGYNTTTSTNKYLDIINSSDAGYAKARRMVLTPSMASAGGAADTAQMKRVIQQMTQEQQQELAALRKDTKAFGKAYRRLAKSVDLETVEVKANTRARKQSTTSVNRNNAAQETNTTATATATATRSGGGTGGGTTPGVPAAGMPRGGRNIAGTAAGIGMAVTSISSMLMFAGGEVGDFAGKVAMAAGALTSISMIGTMLPAGTIGKIGGFFKGLVPAGASVLRTFALFTGWGAVIAGVTAGLVALGVTIYKQQKHIQGLGQAANATADQLKTVGEIFGVQVRAGIPTAASAAAATGGATAEAIPLAENQQFLDAYKNTIEAIKNETNAAISQQVLDSQAISLQAAGFGEQAIKDIIAAIAIAAGKTDLILDFKALSIKDVQQKAQASLNEVNQMGGLSASTGFTASFGPVDTGGAASLTVAGQEQAAIAANETAASMNFLYSELQNLNISQDEFESAFDGIAERILGLNDAAVQSESLRQLVELLGAGPYVDGIKDAAAQMKILEAMISGVDPKKITEFATAQKALEKTTDKDAASSRTAARARKALNDEIAKGTQNVKDANAEQLNTDYETGQEAIDNMIAAERERIALTDEITGVTGDAALAQAIMANETLAAQAAIAFQNGTLEEALPKLKEYLDLLGVGRASSGGGGGGNKSSALDNIVLQLRNVYDASIQTTEGFNASANSLNALFGSGGVSDAVGGLEQQLRSLGASEDLIELIAGMPPEEFNKYKKQLFNFDAAGKSIIGLGAAARNAGEALRRIKQAEFINDQKKFVTNTKNQITAMNRLTAAGVDYSTAYQIVQDTAAATVIATAQSAQEIAEIVNMVQQVAEMTQKMEKISAKQQAVQSVRDANKEYNKRVDLLKKLAKDSANLTSAEVQAILDNPDLQTLYLSPNLDKKALQAALEAASNQAKLEIKSALLTDEGKQQLFDDAMSSVQDMFSTQENAISISFAPQMKAQDDIIRAAERDIADLQYKLDDTQAGLEDIRIQEDEINDRYKDRFDALNKVAAANQRISQQQKSQLSIADALSRGDVAAAARAAADLRAQQAKDAADAQKENLQRAKEAELAGLTSRGGKTKEELLAESLDLNEQIRQIEETRLEPARYAAELLTRQIEDQTASLEVLGKTRDEWDAIVNSTEAATQKLDSYLERLNAGIAAGQIITGDKTLEQVLEELGLNTIAKAATSSSKSSSSKKKTTSAAAAPAPAQVVSTNFVTNGGKGTSNRIAAPAKVTNLPSNWRPTGFSYAASGGIIPKYLANGGRSLGSDIVPAMLTPGEFVVRRPAVRGFGVKNLEKINNGSYKSGSVYNYSLTVNAQTDANPKQIAQTVMSQLKRIDNQRLKGNRF